jgi:hypothetical protein
LLFVLRTVKYTLNAKLASCRIFECQTWWYVKKPTGFKRLDLNSSVVFSCRQPGSLFLHRHLAVLRPHGRVQTKTVSRRTEQRVTIRTVSCVISALRTFCIFALAISPHALFLVLKWPSRKASSSPSFCSVCVISFA